MMSPDEEVEDSMSAIEEGECQTDQDRNGNNRESSSSSDELEWRSRKTSKSLAMLVTFALVIGALYQTQEQGGLDHETQRYQRRVAEKDSFAIRAKQYITDFFVGISLGPAEDGIGFGDLDRDNHEEANTDEEVVISEEVVDEEGDGDDQQCPGQDRYKVLYQEIPGLWSTVLGDFGIADVSKNYERSFLVEPNHTVLKNGVIFNVESTPEARPEDLNQTRLSDDDIVQAVQTEAAQFYNIKLDAFESGQVALSKRGVSKDARSEFDAGIVEAVSTMINKTEELQGGGGIVSASGQGFLAACMTAFAYHLQLALSPDDLWIVIANGFARHVNEHAEELRYNFVNHTGKQEIKVREDTLTKGSSSPEQWEELVFPKFSEAIAEAIGNTTSLHETLAGQSFTTSTVASQAASEIILMATMKYYFDYKLETMCGIPKIRLDGSSEDWDLLRNRTKDLAQYMMQNHTHGDLWITDIVLPILDEFVDSYNGSNINYCFWQNSIKFRSTGDGSGSYDFLSGWLPTLFPYLNDIGSQKPNPHLRHWKESASSLHKGPKPEEIPIQLASVPVEWQYLDMRYPLHFHAGFRGVHQEADGTVKPVIGWYITEDPK